MTILLRQKPLPQVVRQIVQRDNGAWFDPSDLSTLFQDAAGTTPVTAVEQPVGLWLDKSRGLMLGPELVSNGDFSNGLTGWTYGSGTVASGGIISWSGLSGTSFINQSKTLIAGRIYKVTFDISNYVAGSALPIFYGGTQVNGIAFTGNGTKTQYILAKGNTSLSIEVSAPSNFSIDNVSVRELYGYHATQPITASRPTLSARYNLLTKTEDFSGGVWNKTGCTISSNVAQAPNGTISADKMVISSGTWGQAKVSSTATVGGSIPVIAKVTMKAGEKSIGYIQCNSEGGSVVSTCVMFNLSTGAKGSLITIAGAGLINPIAGITPLPNGFYECSLSFTTNATAGPVYVIPGFCDSMSSQSVVGDGVGGAYIFSVDLRIGTDSGPYQRVNTATDYDTDERYFKKYLRFDGVDDYLNLPYMGLYAAGSASVVAAMSENKVAYGTTLINETNSTLTAPMYNPTRQSDIGNNWRSLIRNDANVVTLSSTGALINADGHISVRSRIERESNTAAFENSINKESYNYARAGTLTLDKTTIGALLLGGVMGSPDNMNLYGLIITKSALTDSQRVACERYLGRKSGVQL